MMPPHYNVRYVKLWNGNGAPRVFLTGGRKLAQATWCIAQGFERIGCSVVYLASRKLETKCDPLDNAFDLFGDHVREVRPDILFWTMCKRDCPEGLIAHLKTIRPEMRTVYHSFDDPCAIETDHPQEPKQFDCAVTCCEGSIPWYERQGVKAICLYPPADQELHGKAAPVAAEQCDFSFAATTIYPKDRFPVLADRAEIVRRVAPLGKLHLVGTWGEKNADWGSKYGPAELKECFKGYRQYEEMPGVYASAAINLNSHVRPDGYRYLNERVITCMASGGFMLCDRVNGIEELFRPDVEIVTWGSLDELEEKTRWWLAHPRERAEVAAAGRSVIWQRYSNEHHARSVFALCGLPLERT